MIKKYWSGIAASLVVFCLFLVSISVFLRVYQTGPFESYLFNWFSVGDFSVSWGLLFDTLSALMFMMVTGVGFLIHIYSIGYMHDDPNRGRFFWYLNLFIFFMLTLVLSNNFLSMFVGWEGVGLCSYLLIGFWSSNKDYLIAAKKAFVMNRIGDLGFILGLLVMILTFGSVQFGIVFSQAGLLPIGHISVVLIAILLFVGATGKSAQLPLFTWLPDAMAGPTPVSALIHAATMVTAGIYMIARSHAIYALAPDVLTVVLWVGVATAVVGAIIALRQSDIKKVLAYSTVSQLGFMVAALGAGGTHAALFHMVTHAFFKALLFLAAGSVIHGMGGEQNMYKMGGLRKLQPITFAVFLVGALALSGCPPFSGFFSKDAILLAIYQVSPWAFGVLIGVSVLTAIYVARLVFLVFFGPLRSDVHVHESPLIMTIPLVFLAVLAATAGIYHPEFEWVMVIITVSALAMIWWVTYSRYAVQVKDDRSDGFMSLDVVYSAVIVRPILVIARGLSTVMDQIVLDTAAKELGQTVVQSGESLRRMQSGSIGFYLWMITASVAVILIGLSIWPF